MVHPPGLPVCGLLGWCGMGDLSFSTTFAPLPCKGCAYRKAIFGEDVGPPSVENSTDRIEGLIVAPQQGPPSPGCQRGSAFVW
jgi:hypothetical protein